jgi:hypothetical protein
MTASRFTPPLEYFQAASRASLQSFELARLNHAANLRQEIAALIDQWIRETSEAMLARWILDNQKSLQISSRSPSHIVPMLVDEGSRDVPELTSLLPNLFAAPPRFTAPRLSSKPAIAGRVQKPPRSAVG